MTDRVVPPTKPELSSRWSNIARLTKTVTSLEIPLNRSFNLFCCDCGLGHKVSITWGDPNITLTMTRLGERMPVPSLTKPEQQMCPKCESSKRSVRGRILNDPKKFYWCDHSWHSEAVAPPVSTAPLTISNERPVLQGALDWNEEYKFINHLVGDPWWVAWAEALGMKGQYMPTPHTPKEMGHKTEGVIPASQIKTCTREAPHICKVNGPCNGWPKNDQGGTMPDCTICGKSSPDGAMCWACKALQVRGYCLDVDDAKNFKDQTAHHFYTGYKAANKDILRDQMNRHAASQSAAPKVAPEMLLREYRVALQRVTDGEQETCGCEHDDENCCELVEEFCPHCIAGVALAKEATVAPEQARVNTIANDEFDAMAKVAAGKVAEPAVPSRPLP